MYNLHKPYILTVSKRQNPDGYADFHTDKRRDKSKVTLAALPEKEHDKGVSSKT